MKATLHDAKTGEPPEVRVTLSETNVRNLLLRLEMGTWLSPIAMSMRGGDMKIDPPEPTILIRVQPDDVHYGGPRDNRLVSAKRGDDYTEDEA